jgi:hypothetical protein
LDGNGTVGEHIIRTLEVGVYFSEACAVAGVSSATGHRWRAKGEEALATIEAGEPVPVEHIPFAEFSQGVKTAQAFATVEALGVIRLASLKGEWRAAAWYLERAFPSRWGANGRGQESDLEPSEGISAEEARRHLETLPDTPLARFV